MKHNPVITTKELYDAQVYMFKINYERWIHDVLFTWQWWLLLALIIVPVFVWWKLVDKSRMTEMLVVGLIMAMTASYLDVIGIVFSFWTYGYKLVQMIPALNPIDFFVLPTIYMLIYQWFPKWKSYVIAHVVFAAFATFIAEPMLEWMHIYDLNAWKYLYSFPIYIAIGIGIKAIMKKIKIIQQQRTMDS